MTDRKTDATDIVEPKVRGPEREEQKIQRLLSGKANFEELAIFATGREEIPMHRRNEVGQQVINNQDALIQQIKDECINKMNAENASLEKFAQGAAVIHLLEDYSQNRRQVNEVAQQMVDKMKELKYSDVNTPYDLFSFEQKMVQASKDKMVEEIIHQQTEKENPFAA